MTATTFPWRTLALVLLIALVGRVALLASDSVSFHSDEAIIGLMARHILQGERPVFFYGQAYMGSVDAWLVAGGFALFGDTVQTIRIVQSVLYLLVVAVGFVTAWRLSGRELVALVTGLVMAVPTVNMAVYTTASLGGYNEALLLGCTALLLSYEVTHHAPRSVWRWALMGLCVGVGWWSNGLIITFALPAALLIAYVHLWRRPVALAHIAPLLALGLVCFFIGSAPWWEFDLRNDHAALATYLPGRQAGEFANIGTPQITPLERAFGLAFFGIPALVGLRFPYEAGYFLPLIGVPVVLIHVAALFHLVRAPSPLRPDARGLLLTMLGIFCVIFIVSTFGTDSTGRYLLPLTLPFGIALGVFVAHLRDRLAQAEIAPQVRVALPAALVLLVIGYQLTGQVVAMRSETGLTTQFNPVSHLPHDYDAELMAFLEANDLHHGYSNYWVSFRYAFLSHERLQYSSALPYKDDLSYNPADNRYRPFQQAAENAERVAYITAKLPPLDAMLQAWFAAEGVRYDIERIGSFVIYYNFDPPHPRPPDTFISQ